MFLKVKIFFVCGILVISNLFNKGLEKYLNSNIEIYNSIRNQYLLRFSYIFFSTLAFLSLLLPTFLVVISFGNLLISVPFFKHFIEALGGRDQILVLIVLSTIPSVWFSKRIYKSIISFYSKFSIQLTNFVISTIKTLVNYGTLFFTIRSILYDATYNDLTYTFVLGVLCIFLNKDSSEEIAQIKA